MVMAQQVQSSSPDRMGLFEVVTRGWSWRQGDMGDRELGRLRVRNIRRWRNELKYVF